MYEDIVKVDWHRRADCELESANNPLEPVQWMLGWRTRQWRASPLVVFFNVFTT